MDKSEKKESFGKKYGLILALIAMAIVYLFPTPVDLPTQGHRLIGILVFAVIIWMTEGVSYPVSAFVIVTFMAFALGTAHCLAQARLSRWGCPGSRLQPGHW